MDWIRPGQITFKPRREPIVDKEVSKIVGKKIFTNDRKLIEIVNKRRVNKDPDKMDNFLKDPSFIKELKKEFK